MTENMVPCPLPTVLPKGLRVAPGYTASEEFRLTTIGNARRYGCGQRYFYNGRELTATGQGGFGPDTIDWAHYAALQSAAKPEFKVWERVGWDGNLNSCDGDGEQRGVLLAGRDLQGSLGYRRAVRRDDGRANGEGFWWVNEDLLRLEPPPASFEPVVGQMCEGTSGGNPYRGAFIDFDTHGASLGMARLANAKGLDYYREGVPFFWVDPASLRPVDQHDPSNARHCDKCMNPAVGGGHFCDDHLIRWDAKKPVEPARVDPYAQHAALLAHSYGIRDDVDAHGKMLTRDALARVRKEQAAEQLGSREVFRTFTGKLVDRFGSPANGYQYPEAWESPHSDSD